LKSVKRRFLTGIKRYGGIKEGTAMTKGQAEAKISEAISKFEMEHMGRGPEKIRTIIFQDLIIVRIKGFLSKAETNLAVNREGIDLIKKVRAALFENSREGLEEAIQSILDAKVISTYSDVSTQTGEKLIGIVVDRDLEAQFTK
jgi:uncharacterized protein YbcI